jgi:1-acyl-sn-glycerol-3-phosphate acyltransferase
MLDAARTAYVALADLPPILAKLALAPVFPQPSTTTPDGLVKVAADFGSVLRRLGVILEVREAQRVPEEGGLVFMWNQESHLDHLILAAAIPRAFFSLFNNEVARVPFYGSHMRAAGHVHVDRKDETQWRAGVARAASRVADGECVLVSPEGTRSWDGQLLPMKRGAFMLAMESQRPIVCMTVVGAHARMRRGSAVVRPGSVRVVFSDPIAVGDADPENADARTELMARVAATFEATKLAHALRS